MILLGRDHKQDEQSNLLKGDDCGLRDPASWLPLVAGSSSRNLCHFLLRSSVV